MSLIKTTLDDFDQIGKFKYDKQSDTYALQTNKNGEAQTYIDRIEKGILSDGINFKSNDQILSVGGENQPSVKGVEDFVIRFSDMIDKEIGGYYISKKSSRDCNLNSVQKHLPLYYG